MSVGIAAGHGQIKGRMLLGVDRIGVKQLVGGCDQRQMFTQSMQQPAVQQPVQQAAPAAPQVEESFSDDDLPF